MKQKILVLAPVVQDTQCPNDVFALRWRVVANKGFEISSEYLPETRFPSITAVFGELEGQIRAVYVDAKCRKTGKRVTLFKCPGNLFKKLSYKGLFSQATARTITAGIQVDDTEGNSYLVLRDGTVLQEGVK